MFHPVGSSRPRELTSKPVIIPLASSTKGMSGLGGCAFSDLGHSQGTAVPPWAASYLEGIQTPSWQVDNSILNPGVPVFSLLFSPPCLKNGNNSGISITDLRLHGEAHIA